MTDFDETLRDSFARLSVPADPAGVARAIQARVDAGDQGTPGPSNPGAGRGIPPWMPWLGLIIVAAIVGGSLGLLGVFGRPEAAPASLPAATVSNSASVCAGGCATLTPVPTATPRPSHSTAGHAKPPAKPPAPIKTVPDTTAPTLGTPTADRGTSADPVCVNQPMDASREKATITVPASDNIRVTAVSITWSGPGTDHGSRAMTKNGSVWKFVYDPVSMTSSGTVSFTMQARDAAGNRSGLRKLDLVQLGCVD
jgi:hypothetical protein